MYLLQLWLTAFILGVVAQNPCKTWELGWANYTGVYNSTSGVCKYTNVRYAKPPVGQLRFAAPVYLDGSFRGTLPPAPDPYPSCYQMTETSCIGHLPPNNTCGLNYWGGQYEDCLFLDVYVPLLAFSSTQKLPVVVWFFGGAYLFGSKTQFDPKTYPLYTGDGFVSTASNFNSNRSSVIFVTGNYRLGAFGWLAGDYMEKNGQPNAGLLDQRAILKFVNEYISKLNGEPRNVNVWGESAGASSIMHQLTMPLNIQQPLFQKAIVQSPAYQWLWDRKGGLNKTFTYYAQRVQAKARCPEADMACLRASSTSAAVLSQVNQDLFSDASCFGIMPLGPSVDGNLVPDLAPIRLYANKTMPLESLIVSHVALEIPYSNSIKDWSFIPLPIRESPNADVVFQYFLNDVFTGPQYANIRNAISAKYPTPPKTYTDQISRAAAVIRDSSFTCNTRFLIDRYLVNRTPTWALNYAVFLTFEGKVQNGSVHASDLLPDFANSQTDYSGTIGCLEKNSTAGAVVNYYLQNFIAPGLQRYFTNHAIYNNPNIGSPTGNSWNPATIGSCSSGIPGSCVNNLMMPIAPDPPTNITQAWANSRVVDDITSSSVCDFWMTMASLVTDVHAGGQVARKPDAQKVLADEVV